jgi:enoyl-CoA hydratase
MVSEHDEVRLRREGALGHILLNRPRAMNALNHGMVRSITRALEEWRDDDSVAVVAISGAGERGLCAGGDIVSIYEDARAGGAKTPAFWADEYRLNAEIARYPKPYVAVMDGIVLGGGVGLSAHGSHRVVTERTKTGMPEVTIGFMPDVGGTYLLSRAPGELGTHAALTGRMLSGAEAITLGLADSFVPSDRLDELLALLVRGDAHAAIAALAVPPPDHDLLEQLSWIDPGYAGDDVERIIMRLSESADERARAAASVILGKSPTSVTVTLAALRRARRLETLEQALDQEYRVAVRALAGPDIVEGIRAQVIDKDRNPQWSPADLASVTRDDVDGYFEELGDEELGLSRAPVARNAKVSRA